MPEEHRVPGRQDLSVTGVDSEAEAAYCKSEKLATPESVWTGIKGALDVPA